MPRHTSGVTRIHPKDTVTTLAIRVDALEAENRALRISILDQDESIRRMAAVIVKARTECQLDNVTVSGESLTFFSKIAGNE